MCSLLRAICSSLAARYIITVVKGGIFHSHYSCSQKFWCFQITSKWRESRCDENLDTERNVKICSINGMYMCCLEYRRFVLVKPLDQQRRDINLNLSQELLFNHLRES